MRAGNYKDARGDDACTACAAGKANADTTSIAEAACGNCLANTYSLEVPALAMFFPALATDPHSRTVSCKAI